MSSPKFKAGDICMQRVNTHLVFKILYVASENYFVEYYINDTFVAEQIRNIINVDEHFILKSEETNNNQEQFFDATQLTSRLTKREHFTAIAMQGMLSNPALTMPDPTTGFPICYEICYAAVHYTDRLMEELDKEKL